MTRPLHWGIVGGGLLGMTLAWELAKRGHEVSIFEAGAEPGGLASAWQIGDVVWDRHYHVTLASDNALRGLLAELSLDKAMCWRKTRTGFYCNDRLHPFSGPADYLRFPLLNPMEKLRFGLAIRTAARIESPEQIEHLTVEEWLTRISGRGVFEKMWRPLLRAKLGDDYRSTSATFIWATIRRMFAARRSGLREEQFGYLPGGYSRMLATFNDALGKTGVHLHVNAPAREVVAADGGVEVRFEDRRTSRHFDRVAVTAPAPLAANLCTALTAEECRSLRGVEYLGIVCASVLLRRPLSNFYITNIADESIPLTGIIEMSALVDRQQFGGRSLVYLPRYLRPDDPLFRLSDEQTEAQFIGALQRIHPSLQRSDVLACRISRARHVFPRPIVGAAVTPPPIPPIDTSIPGVHVLNSAHIRCGTLNVNETVQLAQGQARRLHELARTGRDPERSAARVHALARS
ncbi:MAG TPA: NAD(P)/FAD-dependent oxidoreductase [Bryobacteraceae bacterium]|jgi:protoporphyrinogen oxidase|nr:NAD(P)/FAD-dependent oxidoreductase [Bryobacteraceae bacterium]